MAITGITYPFEMELPAQIWASVTNYYWMRSTYRTFSTVSELENYFAQSSKKERVNTDDYT